jgi:hypothetical protein
MSDGLVNARSGVCVGVREWRSVDGCKKGDSQPPFPDSNLAGKAGGRKQP